MSAYKSCTSGCLKFIVYLFLAILVFGSIVSTVYDFIKSVIMKGIVPVFIFLLLLMFNGCVVFGQTDRDMIPNKVMDSIMQANNWSHAPRHIASPLSDLLIRQMDSLKIARRLRGDLNYVPMWDDVPDGMGNLIFEGWSGHGSQDTIPCIMLICDTMHYTNYTPSISQQNYFDKSGTTAWLIGYEVREVSKVYGGVESNGNAFVPAIGIVKNKYTHVEYLDANKHPLSKSIIVWQSK